MQPHLATPVVSSVEQRVVKEFHDSLARIDIPLRQSVVHG